MRAVKDAIKLALNAVGYDIRPLESPFALAREWTYAEASDAELALVKRFMPYSMTGSRRQWVLLRAAAYVDRFNIAGDIAECGVYRAGNILLLKARASVRERRYYLYDTFAGMSEPTEADVARWGEVASTTHAVHQRETHNDWVFASIAEVKSNFRRFGLLDDDLVFIPGKVEETLLIEKNLPKQLAILRLDTDWYQSTKTEMEVLYPRLVRGGILIVDDYGDWAGSRKAVDEYFGDAAPLLIPIDESCRIAIKP